MRSAAAEALAVRNLTGDSTFGAVSPYSSSCGDIARLKLLEPFYPSSNNSTLIVQDICSSQRSGRAAAGTVFFQYDGQFRVKVTKGAQYSTLEELTSYTDVIKNWLDVIIGDA